VGVGLEDEIAGPFVREVLEIEVLAAESTGEPDGTRLGRPDQRIRLATVPLFASEEAGDQGLQAGPVGRPKLHDSVGIVVDQIGGDFVLLVGRPLGSGFVGLDGLGRRTPGEAERASEGGEQTPSAHCMVEHRVYLGGRSTETRSPTVTRTSDVQ
jgi:hypothetical protein